VNHGIKSAGGVTVTVLINIIFFTATQFILQKGGYYERVFRSTLKIN
jgi:hypothetical protein